MKKFGVLIIALLLFTTGCSAEKPDAVSSATMSRYRENEITEYQGARLDPAVGPRDNSIKGVQYVDIEGYQLTIDGLVDTPQTLRYGDVLALSAYERLITLHCVEGWDATILWKGVLIQDLLDTAGVREDAVTVIFGAVDGYTTSLPLNTIVDNQLIMAYQSNGIPLPAEMGYPFIVVAEDKMGYKWARWVNRITLSDDADYEGFWESVGYSNDASVEGGGRD
ncbi:MAG: molybdopterin-dependent oxidoreductase [Clostridiales bacterium]|nr:molybdopterin-dependent oxidoreductase [Clostridiales bacterium]